VRAPDRPPATVVPLVGQRIVADPSSIDAIVAAVPARATVIRFAPDEALVLDGALGGLGVDAIVEDDVGFVAVTVDRAVVARHTEWTLPDHGGVAQGSIAGVPAKLAWLPDGRAWIVTQAAYLADLLDRLT
jgi:hypothetical protein